MRFDTKQKNDADEVIDYSINCYYINEKLDKPEKQTINNESIINYQVGCLNDEFNEEGKNEEVKNEEEKNECKEDEDIIQYSHFNDTINRQLKEENANTANIGVIHLEPIQKERENDENDHDIDDNEIIEYTSQIGHNINEENTNPINNVNDDYPNIHNESSNGSKYQNEVEEQEDSEQLNYSGVQSFSSSEVGDRSNQSVSFDIDVMTYEELLEFQDKIGVVPRGLSDSMIKVSHRF